MWVRFYFCSSGVSIFYVGREFWDERVQVCWEGGGTPLERGILRLASLFYALGLEARKETYRLGLKEASRLPAPVVSVGNITLGGTGKTPMVAWLAEGFRDRGLKVAIESRGYGRKDEGRTLVVSRGRGPLVSPRQGGDEPLMLAKKLSGVMVVVAARRVEGARLAVEELGAELVLLDDGFQHWALNRDLDLVLVSGEEGLGNGRLFPAGPLREPLRALKRAHFLVVTKRENPSLRRLLASEAPQAEIFEAPMEGEKLWSPLGGELLPLGKLKGAKVGAFAGIADPCSFFALLEGYGAEVVEKVTFPDHHFYRHGDLEVLRGLIPRVDLVVTTEKDWVRLEGLDLGFSPWVLKVVIRPSPRLLDRVLERLGMEV